MRKTISKHREAEILFLNRHTCCICQERGRDVQVHHIDGDNSNDDISNLAVLCLDCHSRVTGTRGLGRAFSPLEVKRYKTEWEAVSRKRHALSSTGRTRHTPRIERQLFIYEAKSLIYRMLSADDSDTHTFRAGFESLMQLGMLEGIQKEIIEHLAFAFVLSAISEVNKPVALAKSLPRFFRYLIGPSEVELRRTDEQTLIEAIGVLEFVHNFCVEENKNYKILSASKNALSDFMAIAIRYHNTRIFSKARGIMNEIRKSCIIRYHKHDRTLPRLTREIDALKDDMRKELQRAKLRWKM
jgi:hypothetical protein